MAVFDIDNILNSSPTKRLIRGFNELKSNFNESAAKEYKTLYENESLSFILENSRYIFSEPYYGREFYETALFKSFPYSRLEKEKNKVSAFVEETADNMNDTQKEAYLKLESSMKERCENVKNHILISEFAVAYKNAGDAITALEDAMYEFSCNKCDDYTVLDCMESVNDPYTFFTYADTVAIITEDADAFSNAHKFFKESAADDVTSIDEKNWAQFCEATTIVHKLSQDVSHSSIYSRIPGKMNRLLMTGLAEENVMEHVNEIFTEKVEDNGFNFISSDSMVNHLFEDAFLDVLTESEDNAIKAKREKLNDMVFESIEDLVTFEYGKCNETSDKISGYTMFEEDTTYDDALKIVTEKSKARSSEWKSPSETRKHKDEESDDDDDSHPEGEQDADQPSDDVEDDNDEKDDSSEDQETDTKKTKPQKTYSDIVKPMPKSIANSIQVKAMDAEAKQLQAMSKGQKAKMDVKNAVKAVANIPNNIVEAIKNQARTWEKADEDRRKSFIIEPGFRKHIFHNLKMAILYGGAATTNIALVPVVAIARHFSKEKDVRIRRECAREIDTEIKICDEKINDAQNNGDAQEKYKLMRIKSQLEAESLRVKSNSKYV